MHESRQSVTHTLTQSLVRCKVRVAEAMSCKDDDNGLFT